MTLEADPSQVKQLPMAEIFHDEDFNCRGRIIPLDVQGLAQSIQENGLIQPIIVRPYSKGPRGTKYQVVAGYRRHLAHRINNAEVISAIIRDLTDRDAKFLNLSENFERQDLNFMQEARAIEKFFDEGMTQQEVADRLHKSRMWVQTRLYALQMPEPIQAEIEVGLIKAQDIIALKGLPEEVQIAEVKRIKEKVQAGEKRQPLSKQSIKKDSKARIARKKPEIERMRDHILDTVGGNIGSRALAWAAGNISSHDLFMDLKEIADEQGIIYIVPDEDL